MGVSHLWQLLREEGLVATWKGNEGQHTAIAPEIDGQAVAVDLSLWLMQASSQPDLIANFPNPEERCLKVAFERASNWLRYGCVPVGVVEGRTPPEKLERLQQRFRAANGCAGGGGGSSQFIRLGRSVGKLLESMGLPVVYAPGEAEASCAALNRHGYVDGCATADGDVLVFGAQTVYHTLKLQTAEPGNAELVRCCMADVRRALGLKRGGQLALLAVGLLTGGDYDTQGATNVGHTYAMSVVRHLLQGKEDDLELLKDLRRLLGRPPDAELQALGERGCTGCKRCKHEGHMKGRVMKHHKRNPCAGCHMAGDMCELRAEAPCECEFHRREMERFIDRAVRRVRASDAFAERAAAAQRAYLSQADVASASAHDTAAKYGLQAGDKFTWLRRPDVDKMYRIMDEGHLRWNEQLVRQKTLPLLIDWDVSHPPLDSLPYAPPAASGEAPAAARVQFAAASIAKVHGLRSQTDDASKCWRYLLNIERLDVGPDEVAEADREWLKKADSVEKRAVRMSAVRRSQPQLVEAYEQGLAAKADAEAAKKARAAERAQKKLLKEAASAGASAKSSQSAASKAILANFIKQSKPGSSDGCREDDVDDFAILGSPSKRQQTPNAKSRLHGASRVVDADGDSAYPDSTQRPVRQGVARALLAGPTPHRQDRPSRTATGRRCLLEPSVANYMDWLEASRDGAPHSAGNSNDIIFAVWFAQGDRGAEGHDRHHLAKPNLSFASVVQKSHPRCRVVVLSDQYARDETWRTYEGQQLEIFRIHTDKTRLGRNAYANYYQFLAQIAFMRTLIQQGVSDRYHLVFMDVDVLVVDSIAEVFGGASFDYALSISDAPTMPINTGTQFICKGRYPHAIDFLHDVLSIYPFQETFVAGQIALAEYLQLRHAERAVYATHTAAVRDARACTRAGNATLCFLTCLRYNYCHMDESCSTNSARLPISLETFDQLERARPKILHFVGYRKAALNVVHNAYMQGGREAAYAMWLVLPTIELAMPSS
ncbi:hypothetical protein WJX72_012549 [[Myrmecia] bisecta]|uniref:XPG-I domain-containing protein n=1 Tax=[Myrmecia] bisecta TaxID=41462 RepID=A0AAW1Q8W6_9CHLO